MIHEANLQQNTAVVVYLAITQNSFTVIKKIPEALVYALINSDCMRRF